MRGRDGDPRPGANEMRGRREIFPNWECGMHKILKTLEPV